MPILIISDQTKTKFLSGSLTSGFKWVDNKELAFTFRTINEAAVFNDSTACEFLNDSYSSDGILEYIVDYHTLETV